MITSVIQKEIGMEVHTILINILLETKRSQRTDI